VLSSAFDLCLINICAFSHPHIVRVVVFAGGTQNMEVASHVTQSSRIEKHEKAGEHILCL
jgi:hypothetical protein